jgi:rhodanese-related sulfurtransferase
MKMASKKRPRAIGYHPAAPADQNRAKPVKPSHNRLYLALAGGIVALATILAIGLGTFGGTSNPSPSPSGMVVASQAVRWTDVAPDQLAVMLEHKDFTLVDVKTPYVGEIDGTDLYIPYDQLAARASQLPANKAAKILVYCRSGVQSAQAAQTLLSLGYTNIWNLAGGMNAWQQSGRAIVDKNRQ